MPSLSSSLIPWALRAAGANRVFVSSASARRHLRRRALRPRPYGPPRWLRRDVSVCVDSGPGWPVYTVTPRAGTVNGSLVYVHGGGWVNGTAPQHWQLAARIAVEARLSVSLPIYPLVPFGTAATVVPAIASLVLDGNARHGWTALAGDSAGGQIALSAALLLRDEHGIALPRTVLIAPALDLSFANPQIDAVQPSDPWLGREGTRVFADHWRGTLAVDDPMVSPLAADLHHLGPLTIFSGTRDILNPDTRLLVEKATRAGVDVDYHEEPGLVHVYPLTPSREGRAARAVIVDTLRTARAREIPPTREIPPRQT